MARIISLGGLLCLALVCNLVILVLSPLNLQQLDLFYGLWLISFLVYFLACACVLRTRPAQGRLLWVELGIILFGALLLRGLLLPIPPDGKLSHDSWRYLWDARVTLRGYSPYVYVPNSAQFVIWRDILYYNSDWHNVPTIYPPTAQAFYLLSYLLSPSNIYVLKGIFILCDLLSCLMIIWLLRRRGMDAARVILYAWCPLPIVEFAMQGHVDVLMITFSLITVIVALTSRPAKRGWVGFWLAVTALTKLYPVIFGAALWRRYERLLPIVMLLTIGLSYLPYLVLGHGQVFGFFATYLGERGENAGPILLVVKWVNNNLHFSGIARLYFEDFLFALIIGSVAFAIWHRRQKEQISIEGAFLLLCGIVLFVSPHVYTWYTTVLLPWVAILWRPLWARRTGLNGRGLVICATWYFACISATEYYLPHYSWPLYQYIAYTPIWIMLFLAAIVFIRQHRSKKRRASVHPQSEELPIQVEV